MAINSVVYSPKDVKFGLSEESTFGTPIADNGAFIQYAEFDSVTVNYGLTQVADLRNRARRMIDKGDLYTSQTGGIRTISVSGIPLRVKDAAELLYAVTQSVTEASTTPYQKVFNIDWTSQPDSGSNAGFFCTIGLWKQIDGYHEKFTSCIATSLTLNYDGVGGDGRIMADIEFVTGFAVLPTSTFSGTWTVNTQSYIDGHAFGTKSITATDVVCYGWDLTINNNAVRVGNDASGECQTYAIGVGGNGMELTGNIKVKYDANVQALKADYVAGTTRAIILSKGSTGVDGYFLLSLLACYFTDHTDEAVDQGAAINLPFTGVYESGNEITLAVADAVDKAW